MPRDIQFSCRFRKYFNQIDSSTIDGNVEFVNWNMMNSSFKIKCCIISDYLIYFRNAIWRFKEENKALMRRLYGDVDSTEVYRNRLIICILHSYFSITKRETRQINYNSRKIPQYDHDSKVFKLLRFCRYFLIYQ